VVLAKFADFLIVTLFSEEYRPAVVVFQLYLLVLLREAMDFSIPLRAIDRTSAILRSNLAAIVINAALLLVMLPTLGLLGGVIAYIISRAVEGFVLGRQTMRGYAIGVGALASWGDLAKVCAAAALASPVLYGSFWTQTLGIFGVAIGGLAYLTAFVSIIALLRVPEMALLMRRARSLTLAFTPRP
jgi:O-antigen/teichoic acid export membrane protein